MADASATQTIEIEGRRYAWRAFGGGPPLVLINGYASTRLDWDPTMLELLAGSFEVICPDNRGMGDSDLGEGALSADAMAADVEALIEHLGFERVAVAGWSMGGFIAQSLALRSPSRVTAMGLMSTDHGGPDAPISPPDVWFRLTDHTGAPREQASRLIALLFPPDLAPEMDRQFGEVLAAARAEVSGEALSAQEAAMIAWHAEEQPRPQAPPHAVLIAHGDEDEVIPAANAELLAARWPGSRVERFAGAGHAFMAQEPGRIAELLISSLG